MKIKRAYLVEGKCEELLIKYLISKDKILPGKVYLNNITNTKITIRYLIQFNDFDEIIFVYDTDINNTNIIDENIERIKEFHNRIKFYHLQSVYTIEDEIVRASSINNIHKLFNTKTIKDYKKEFCQCSNLNDKLNKIAIIPELLWTNKPNNSFDKYYNKDNQKHILKK